MGSLVVEKDPPRLPVCLAEYKDHLQFPQTESDSRLDALLTSYLTAAVDVCEKTANKVFIRTGFRQCLDSFPYYVDAASAPIAFTPSENGAQRYSSNQWNYTQRIKLLRSPVLQVSRIEYVATDGTLKNLYPDVEFEPWEASTKYDEGEYVLDSNGNVQEATSVGDDASSGATAPAWPTNPGDTVNDDHIVWTMRGPKSSFSDFLVDSDSTPARIFPKPGGVWPATLYVPNAVRIHFFAGFGSDADTVPERFKVAIKIVASGFNEIREPGAPIELREVPLHVKNLLKAGDRVIDFAPTRG